MGHISKIGSNCDKMGHILKLGHSEKSARFRKVRQSEKLVTFEKVCRIGTMSHTVKNKSHFFTM